MLKCTDYKACFVSIGPQFIVVIVAQTLINQIIAYVKLHKGQY